MVRKIALEEHFLSPGYDEYWGRRSAMSTPSDAANLLPG